MGGEGKGLLSHFGVGIQAWIGKIAEILIFDATNCFRSLWISNFEVQNLNVDILRVNGAAQNLNFDSPNLNGAVQSLIIAVPNLNFESLNSKRESLSLGVAAWNSVRAEVIL